MVYCLLSVVRWLVFVVCCLCLFFVGCLLSLDVCLLFFLLLSVVRGVLFVVRCLFIVYCVVCIVYLSLFCLFIVLCF